MRVTYNWLKDFVDIKISAQALADKLTMAGLEVTSLKEKAGDFVFEIEVTSNRPDWLSVIGIAREVAAITGRKLKFSYQPSAISRQQKAESRKLKAESSNVVIKVENKKDCPLYTAKIIQDVKVGPSPDWLRKRLELIGCRSVNNIVDITNYVLFEFGEPLHAFDLDKIVSQLAGYPVSQLEINIRRARNKEEITTIDGIRRILDENILVIASRQTGKPAHRQTGKPIALAGIMGGKDTEVTQGTKNILLEAAVFNPILIRRARQALGLQSESAYRFERSVNPDIVGNASLRCVELIEELAAGKCILARSCGVPKSKIKSITLNPSTVNKILGTNISTVNIRKILTSLGFEGQSKKNNLTVKVPSHRQDVNLDVDLIEEVSRIYGFENMPKTLPKVSPKISPIETRDLVSLAKNILAGLGLNEVITYSLIDKGLLRIFGRGNLNSEIKIMNPLSAEQEILRPGLSPSLIRCIATNLNHKQEYVNIFEIAKVFSGDPAKEELVLGIALSGAHSLLLEQGLIRDPAGILHLKGILEVLFERLGVKNYKFEPGDSESIFNILAAGEKIGEIAKIQKIILDKLDIKNKDVFSLEISLDKLFSFAQLKKKFVALAKYPGITRDTSFIIKDGISAKDLLEAVKEIGGPLLGSAKIADYYKGKQIPDGYKGLTISCFYRSNERTLTEAEINPAHALICDLLQQRFAARIR